MALHNIIQIITQTLHKALKQDYCIAIAERRMLVNSCRCLHCVTMDSCWSPCCYTNTRKVFSTRAL